MIRGHSAQVLSVAWHPLHNVIITGSADHTLRVSAISTNQEAMSHLLVATSSDDR